MKLAFKYSLLILALLVGLFGAVGTYFLFLTQQIISIQYHYPFLALLSISGFLYHKKTLFFYKGNHERARAGYTLDEDLVLDDLQAPHIESYLWLFTYASALHLIGYSAHFAMLLWDEIGTEDLLEPIIIVLVPCLYLNFGTLLDFIGVSKKIRLQKEQHH